MYEGSTKVWENYKAQLEKEVEAETAPVSVVNPVEQMNEMFPEAEFEFPDGDEKYGGFFRARFTVAGTTYEGVGLSKRDAKANAAANTIDALEKNGQLEQRLADLEAKRKERQEKQKLADKADADKVKVEKSDKELAQNPNVKLQEYYPQVVYRVLGETPLRNTAITAFIAAVMIGEQSFIGVGRSKKLAKTAAAEKALRELGYWTKDDEESKQNRLKATRGEVIPPLLGVEGFGAIPSHRGVHSLLGSLGVQQYGRRGRGGWNYGRGSRGYPPRGRGYAPGYDAGDLYGDDSFGDEYEGLDLMIGELSGLVGEILETNPNLGVSDVWQLLQRNPQYQSWRGSTFASNMPPHYQNYDSGYYGASADPSYGYSGDGYYQQPEMYMMPRGRGQVNIRRWSRNTRPYSNRGGRNAFQNSASYW